MTVLSALPACVPTLPRENYVMAGQSNMSGRGFLSYLTSLAATDPYHPLFTRANRVKIFGNDLQWRAGAEPTDLSTNQVDTVTNDFITIAGGVGVSPGMSFATTLAKLRPNREIGLITCAIGATSMAQWQRNLSQSTIYGMMIYKIGLAQAQGQLTGMLFDQGHSDATTSSAIANAWGTSFLQLISDLRADCLSLFGITRLPVVYAIMPVNPNTPSTNADFPYWTNVRNAQLAVSGTDMVSISTDDITTRTDAPEQIVHFDAPGQVLQLGPRYAPAMHELIESL